LLKVVRQIIDEKIFNKIWADWEKFASYAFNKSHSTCYAYVAFQTAYLKANYPSEFMAAVLSHNMNDIKQVNFFLSECRRMNITTLGPDVNESDLKFSVNKKGEVRFALSALKGVGEAAVSAILEERENGFFTSIFDFTRRVNLRAVNKKNIEVLAQAGAFDGFGNTHRAQYFHIYKDDSNFIELAIRFGNNVKERANSNAFSLFGNTKDAEIPEPEIPHENPWNTFDQLQKEKEVTGIYISGHPLDEFSIEIKNVCNALLLKGFYKTSYRDPEKYELNVTQMEFMQDVLEKYGKGMRVMLDYNKLDEQKVEKIYKIVSKHTGKKPFTVYLYDDAEAAPLTFQSSKTGIRVSTDLFEQLAEIPDIAVKLIV
jgi:DNA polymerase III alpha subunit